MTDIIEWALEQKDPRVAVEGLVGYIAARKDLCELTPHPTDLIARWTPTERTLVRRLFDRAGAILPADDLARLLETRAGPKEVNINAVYCHIQRMRPKLEGTKWDILTDGHNGYYWTARGDQGSERHHEAGGTT